MAVDSLWEWRRELEIGGVFAVQCYRGLYRRSGTERMDERGKAEIVQLFNQ